MVATTIKRFDDPDEVHAYEFGRMELVEIGGLTIGREVVQPGWRWSLHVKPIVGTETCRIHHVGICVSGHMRTLLADGSTVDVSAGDLYDIPPGHDAWVVGDQPVVLHEISAAVSRYAAAGVTERVLVTLVSTDVVGSTAVAERLGPGAWHDLVAVHDRLVRDEIERHAGRVVKPTGDGFVAAFDGPGMAVRFALAVVERVRPIDLQLRVGVHTGEVEFVAGQLQGLALHVAERVMRQARGGEVLVTATTRDLLSEAWLEFEERGSVELRGLRGARTLYAALAGPRR